MLVIQGLEDEIAPVQNGHFLQEEFPERVTVVDLPDLAHGLAFQAPALIATKIVEWVNDLPA